MKKLIQHKLDQLRQKSQPERMRAAITFSFIAGSVLVLLWVTVILPLELRGLKGPANSSSTGVVAGIESDATPSPTSSETFVSPTPSQTQVFKNLPSSEDSTNNEPSLPVSTTP